ncbi:efflux pump, RND family, membrane fusion protein [Geotalea daltonii FRC-32]|uniref:Efflux pump, RND family, membrane fusion protein n=1 Tax=Geotalea daltonii (strain DSM 22248 / JCM 15807 / FRC-32) TaxID=316067 RepID=B9M1N8_GEODF|nr:efflux pump, RND family, membrane fusion protein [Geotalea daltonii FRC-32]
MFKSTHKRNCYISFRLILFLLLLNFLLTGCAKKKEKPKGKPPVPVAVATVQQKTVPITVNAVGNVEPFNSVPVKAQVNGIISRVHFREGQDVQKGDLLFTIDPGTYRAALKQAEANLARDLALARNAEEQAGRYAALVKDGIVTQEQYDQLKTNAEAFSAAVAADRAAVENARIQLSYCYIRSPIPGRTGSLLVNVGSLVKGNDTAALVTINQISPIYVSFTVPEKQLAAINTQVAGGSMIVEALVPNDAQGSLRGVVSFLDNTVDTTTGTIRLKGTFPNGDRRLWPGQFVNVSLILGTRPNAIVIPAAAVQTSQQGQFVFVIGADKKAELRPISPSISDKGLVVIDHGLRPGEVVVTDGVMRLTPGAQIEIKKGGPGKLQPSSPMGQK